MRLKLGTSMFLVAACLAACGGSGAPDPSQPTGQQGSGQSAATCPPPPTIPTPIPAWLSYPPNGSTSVSTTIGQIVEQGAEEPPNSGITLVVSSSAGNVPLGAPTIAPSPFPSPFSTTPPSYGTSGPYISIPLPTLSPNTTYDVAQQYTGWDNNPPQCSATITQAVGKFTTGN